MCTHTCDIFHTQNAHLPLRGSAKQTVCILGVKNVTGVCAHVKKNIKLS